MDGDFEACQLPVIELETSSPAALRDALERFGFFYLRTTMVPETLLERVYAQSRLFFQQPEALKRLALANEHNRGFNPFQEEVLDPGVQREGDLKEGYYIGVEPECGPEGAPLLEHPLSGPNVFPPNFTDDLWRDTMLEYHAAMCRLGFATAGLLARALDLEGDFFSPFLSRPIALLRLLHYSADLSDVSRGLFGAGAHSDYGMLTFLSTDGTPGLQVLMEGRWMNVPHKEGCFIVNIGDMVQRWTNDKIKSTLHRVVKLTPLERYSIPFFYEPNFDTNVVCLPQFSLDCPPKYLPITSGQHLLDKYRQTHTSFTLPPQ